MKWTSSDVIPFDTDTELLALGLPKGDPPALPSELDGLFHEGLADLLLQERFKGRVGATLTVHSLGRIPAKRLLLVGLGKGSIDDLREAAGAVGMAARRHGARSVALDFGPLGQRGAAALLEGFTAGNYKFDRYRSEQKRRAPCSRLQLALGSGTAAPLEAAMAVARAQSTVRDLVNEPAEVIYPATLARFAQDLGSATMTVQVWDEEKIRRAGMGGLHAVGRGRARPPRVVHMRYAPPGGASRAVALVGKGVTFDSGGMSLKPSDGMNTMRCDMAGAATVIGALQAADELQLALEVHGIFGAAENMNAAASYKLGDILTMYNGRTVEVHNTDAEGRLILADCLAYASELDVECCLDLATLTGACVVALGSRYTGLFTEDDDLADELFAAAEAAGDGMWRLPLAEHFRGLLKAEWADSNHVGPRWGGASIAAAFLSGFVDGPRWAHLDLAGPAFLNKPERYYAKGASGAMLRTMVHWLRSVSD